MRSALFPFVAIADAVALLLRPHAEVVIHDLQRGELAHIAGKFSRREAGDSSLGDLENIGALDEFIIGPYSKMNWDGRRIKSITAIISDDAGAPIGLLCINLDVSIFDALQAICRDFLTSQVTDERPVALFRDDWREDVNEIIGRFLTNIGATAAKLDRPQRVELINLLDARGLFEVRNAVPYIASLLRLSRATLYKSLSAARLDAASTKDRS